MSTLRVSAGFGIGIVANSSNIVHKTVNNRRSTTASGLAVVSTPLIHNQVTAIIPSMAAMIAPNRSISMLIARCKVTVGPHHGSLRSTLDGIPNLPICSVRSLRGLTRSGINGPRPLRFASQAITLIRCHSKAVVSAVGRIGS